MKSTSPSKIVTYRLLVEDWEVEARWALRHARATGTISGEVTGKELTKLVNKRSKEKHMHLIQRRRGTESRSKVDSKIQPSLFE